MQLDTEYNYLKTQLPALRSVPDNIGKYVLVHGEKIIDLFPAKAEAYERGYALFGLGTFLIKQIVENEEPVYFSRTFICQ